MTSQTATATTHEVPSVLGLTSSFPSTLPPDILCKFPKLSPSQAGHLRHFHNLATQPDGEWRHMGSQDPGQEWLDSYRYQLATMAYAAGAAHYHRMPALRSVFKTLMEQLIHKMLRREVWGYWDGPPTDDEGNWVFTDPFTGNAAIGYARLNVPDGQRKMWEEPWGREHFEREPWVEGAGLGSGVDFLRGAWDEGTDAFAMTMRSWDRSGKRIDLNIRNLPAGSYGIYQDGELLQVRSVRAGDVVDLGFQVGGDELDVVLLRSKGTKSSQ